MASAGKRLTILGRSGDLWPGVRGVRARAPEDGAAPQLLCLLRLQGGLQIGEAHDWELQGLGVAGLARSRTSKMSGPSALALCGSAGMRAKIAGTKTHESSCPG